MLVNTQIGLITEELLGTRLTPAFLNKEAIIPISDIP